MVLDALELTLDFLDEAVRFVGDLLWLRLAGDAGAGAGDLDLVRFVAAATTRPSRLYCSTGSNSGLL